MSKYSDKLKNPKWQKVRLKVLERDEWRCVWCTNDESTLHVHHKTYKYGKEPWEYPLNNFLTLCEECHEEETNGRKEEENALLDALRLAGFSHVHLNELLCNIYKYSTENISPYYPMISAISMIFGKNKFRKKFIDLYFKFLEKNK